MTSSVFPRSLASSMAFRTVNRQQPQQRESVQRRHLRHNHTTRPAAGAPLRRSRAYFSNSSTDTSPAGASLYIVSSTSPLTAAAAVPVPAPPVRPVAGVLALRKFIVDVADLLCEQLMRALARRRETLLMVIKFSPKKVRAAAALAVSQVGGFGMCDVVIAFSGSMP